MNAVKEPLAVLKCVRTLLVAIIAPAIVDTLWMTMATTVQFHSKALLVHMALTFTLEP